MRKHLGLLTAGAAALAFALGMGPAIQSAHAEFFEYTGTVSVNPITGFSSVSDNGTGTVTLTTSGGETVTLNVTPSNDPSYHINATGLGSDIVFSTISVAPSPSTALQDIGFEFTYSITITDYANEMSGGAALGSGTFDISGLLNGSIGSGRAVNLNNLQNYAVSPTSQVIGGARYTVTPGQFFFTPPGVGRDGTFGVHVEAQAIPEPVSVISTAMGFLALGGFLARGRRRNRKVLAA